MGVECAVGNRGMGWMDGWPPEIIVRISPPEEEVDGMENLTAGPGFHAAGNVSFWLQDEPCCGE